MMGRLVVSTRRAETGSPSKPCAVEAPAAGRKAADSQEESQAEAGRRWRDQLEQEERKIGQLDKGGVRVFGWFRNKGVRAFSQASSCSSAARFP